MGIDTSPCRDFFILLPVGIFSVISFFLAHSATPLVRMPKATKPKRAGSPKPQQLASKSILKQRTLLEISKTKKPTGAWPPPPLAAMDTNNDDDWPALAATTMPMDIQGTGPSLTTAHIAPALGSNAGTLKCMATTMESTDNGQFSSMAIEQVDP
jgi:hypothetical protein